MTETDVMAGQTTAMFASLDSALGQIKGGKLRALAVTGPRRTPLLPDVPTMVESGLEGFEILGWAGLLAPAGTPASTIEMLNAHILAILKLPEVAARCEDLGAEAAGSTPQAFGGFIHSEIERWARVVKDAGVKAE